MKTNILTVFALLLLLPLTASAKKGMVIAHYGSSDDATRAQTIELITADIRAALPGIEVREAYISPIVRRSMTKRGLQADSPEAAMMKLLTEGVDTLYLQSTTILDGGEMAEVRKAADLMKPFFAELKVGRPLCYSPDDCMEVARILAAEPHDKDEAVIFVGHGNLLPSTATYCQLDLMLRQLGAEHCHVSTIEGYPTVETTLCALNQTQSPRQTNALDQSPRKLKLVPFLLVCGNHTKQDIAGPFSDALRAAGYAPTTLLRGLAELPAIRALYVSRARTLTTSP